jgi:hypothetical protein
MRNQNRSQPDRRFGIVEINKYGARERTLKRNHFDFAENLRERRVSDSERRQPVSDSEIGHGK